jgi:anthranilate phosphoribosyltransferase
VTSADHKNRTPLKKTTLLLSGPVADALNLNAGVALAACKVVDNAIDGVALAQEVQRSGKGLEVMKKWVEASQAAAKAESLILA